MAAELGWTKAEIREAAEDPQFFQAVSAALLARRMAPSLQQLNVSTDSDMTAKQRSAIAKMQRERRRVIRWLYGDQPLSLTGAES